MDPEALGEARLRVGGFGLCVGFRNIHSGLCTAPGEGQNSQVLEYWEREATKDRKNEGGHAGAP